MEEWRNEGNILFNDALNILLCGIRHMLKDHLREENLCFHFLSYCFRLAASNLTDMTAQTMAFVEQ